MTKQAKIAPYKLVVNQDQIVYNYSAEVRTTVTEGSKTQHSCVVLVFTLVFLKKKLEGNLAFQFKVGNRFFLDDKNRPIFNLTKAQKIALEVAKINDDLVIETSPNYGFLAVKNTDQILNSWKNIKKDILEAYPDLNIVVTDFDWQMKEENIQNIYKNDNFYSFFFANFFNKELNSTDPIKQTKIVTNGLGNLDIPIQETLHAPEQNNTPETTSFKIEAKLDIKHKKFPLAKLNIFLGQLPTQKGSNHDLDFNYNGYYNVNPKLGVITQGNLLYSFEIKDLYKKTTTINFELDTNE